MLQHWSARGMSFHGITEDRRKAEDSKMSEQNENKEEKKPNWFVRWWNSLDNDFRNIVYIICMITSIIFIIIFIGAVFFT